MAVGVVVRDAGGTVVFANPAAHRIFGRPPDQLIGTSSTGEVRRFREDGTPMPDDEVPNVAAQRRGEAVRNVVMGLARADGYVRWLLIDAVPVKNADGSVRQVVSSFTDVTDRKRAGLDLVEAPLQGPVSGLLTRALLADRLDQAIHTSQRLGTPVAVLVVGLNPADREHADIGALLVRQLRASDSVAQLAGDELAVVLPGAGPADAEQIARKLLASLDTRAPDSGKAAIGIVIHPDDGAEVETLLRGAELAMDRARELPGRIGTSQIALAGTSDPRTLATDIRRGLERGELTLVYQPIVDIATRAVARVEVLSRWAHPTRGPIPPRELVAAAARSGLARPFLEHVLVASFAQCRAWHDLGLGLGVSVNLAPADIADPELQRIVSHRLAEARIEPAWVALEVSESIVTADPSRSVKTLERLVELGVHLAIDDLGVGSTSLGYLERLPAHTVKIDGSVVGRVTRDTNKQSIVALVIELGHTLGLRVTAEGIEDKATLRALGELHCDEGQGHFLARPMVADAIVPWMSRSATSRSAP